MKQRTRKRVRQSRTVPTTYPRLVRPIGTVKLDGLVIGHATNITFDIAPEVKQRIDRMPEANPLLPNFRDCTDDEYNAQRRCWHCSKYSFKSYTSDDENSGKCFARYTDEHPRILWVEGKNICDLFTPEAPESCCDNEDRNMNGGCNNCGDPCL